MEQQKIAFFSGKWNKIDDNAFLTHLELFANLDNKVIEKKDRAIFEAVCDMINPKGREIGGSWFNPVPFFTLSDCYRRYELAELRYHTWKQIIEHNGVQYHALTNTVRASNEVWKELLEMHSLGLTYRWELEYRLDELKTIFYPFAPRGLNGQGDREAKLFDKTLDELFQQIAAETEMLEEESEEEDVLGLFPIIPPDVMSTTKGKGHILYDPYEKPISASLRFAKKNTDPNVEGTPSGTKENVEKKGGPSSGSVCSLDF